MLVNWKLQQEMMVQCCLKSIVQAKIIETQARFLSYSLESEPFYKRKSQGFLLKACSELDEAHHVIGASLVAQMVKNLLAMQETQARCLSWEDPLEKEMATHSSILTWRIPWTEEPGGLLSVGSLKVRHD